MSEEEIPDRTIHVADSVDEFVERTRLQQIHESKVAAAEALREARFEASSGNQIPAREHAAGAVEMYILEVESLYKQTDNGRALWSRAELGEVPLGELVPKLDLSSDGVTLRDVEFRTRGDLKLETERAGEEIEQATVYIDGVGSYVDGLTGTVRAEITRQTRNGRAYDIEHETRAAPLSAPIEVSREAYRATNALLSLSEVGVKLADDGSGAVDNEYTEFLENLDDVESGD